MLRFIRLILALAAILTGLLSACAPANPIPQATPPAGPAESPTARPVEPTPTYTAPEPTPTPLQPEALPEASPSVSVPDASTADACPEAGADTRLYTNLEEGYCLLYPADFELSEFTEFAYHRMQLTAPQIGAAAAETLRVVLVVESNGPAGGMDGQQYAQAWIERFLVDGVPEREERLVAGQPAVVLRNLAAHGPVDQGIYLAVNDRKYRLVRSPDAGFIPALDETAQAAWDLLLGSIVFFKPQGELMLIRPEDACPQPSGDLLLYVNWTGGYCLLYPADFTPSPDFPGDFEGGPVLAAGTAWGDVRASLTVGAFGSFPGESVLDVLEPRRELIDQSSIQETVIGGYPAVIFRDPRGPWASRQAMIMVDGFVYTIVNQPWDPAVFPEGMPYLDRIWNTITSSLAFFTPWR